MISILNIDNHYSFYSDPPQPSTKPFNISITACLMYLTKTYYELINIKSTPVLVKQRTNNRK